VEQAGRGARGRLLWRGVGGERCGMGGSRWHLHRSGRIRTGRAQTTVFPVGTDLLAPCCSWCQCGQPKQQSQVRAAQARATRASPPRTTTKSSLCATSSGMVVEGQRDSGQVMTHPVPASMRLWFMDTILLVATACIVLAIPQ